MTTPPARRRPSLDWRHALTALVTAILAVGVTITVDNPGPSPAPAPSSSSTVPHRAVTVTLGGPGHAKVTLPPAAQAVAQGQALDQAATPPAASSSGENDLKAEPPASRAPAVVAHNRAMAPPGQPVSPATIPQAAVHVNGCRTLHVRNYSSRTGSPTLLFVEHQTISPDNGWAGVLGNVRWFDSPAAQASSNFVISRAGGQCAYIVPMAYKAWAQAGFNSVAVSVEVTETGRDATYLVGPGLARMVALMRLAHHVYGIPYRHGRVSGCSVIRAGYVEHADLGQCGGGHHDDNPPCASACFDRIIAMAAAADRPAPVYLSGLERRLVAELVARRRDVHAGGGWNRARAPVRRRAIAAANAVRAEEATVRRRARAHGGLAVYHRAQRLAELRQAVGH